ncbi:centrobin [Protopterus annectens]|uniref:centrobin n=1 Tax=Protopterus annectens TaxID=7888 RepID=UPI001CFAD592|nr:centrobin [Protopterus annectens]
MALVAEILKEQTLLDASEQSVCLSDDKPLSTSPVSSTPVTPHRLATPSPCCDIKVSSTLAHSAPSLSISCIASSAEVTSRLYTSLQRSKEIEAKVWSSLDSHLKGQSAVSEKHQQLEGDVQKERLPFEAIVPLDHSTHTILQPTSLSHSLVSVNMSQLDKCKILNSSPRLYGFSYPPSFTTRQKPRLRSTNCLLDVSSGMGSDIETSSSSRESRRPPGGPVHLHLSERSAGASAVLSYDLKNCVTSEDSTATGNLAEVTAVEGLECLADEMTQISAAGLEASSSAKGRSRHISDMETVRSHLQSMLKVSRENRFSDFPSLPSAPVISESKDDSLESDSTTTLLNAIPLEDISPPASVPEVEEFYLPDSVPGIEEFFPLYSRLHLAPTAGAPSMGTQTQILRDTLEKERARRKHCENHIRNLQKRVMELQQQLAVAVTADRKKDIMIEQLDKTLAKVVEGWRKQEAERAATMKRLQEERENAERAKLKQQEMLSRFEESLSQAVEAMAKEQEQISQLQKDQQLLEQENSRLLRNLELEKNRSQSLQIKIDESEQARKHAEKQLESLRVSVEEQRDSWVCRERELQMRYTTMEQESQRQLEKERESVNKESQRATDAQRVLASVQSEVQRLEAELDTIRQEKAQYQTQKSQLESEFKTTLEQKVIERLMEVHEENTRQAAAVREQHRKQITELKIQHEKELATQLACFQSDLTELDQSHNRITEEKQRRLEQAEEEIQELTGAKRRLEAQRTDLVNKFQTMMHTHWNEVLRVLTADGSPQSRNQQLQYVCAQDLHSFGEQNTCSSSSDNPVGLSLSTEKQTAVNRHINFNLSENEQSKKAVNKESCVPLVLENLTNGSSLSSQSTHSHRKELTQETVTEDSERLSVPGNLSEAGLLNVVRECSDREAMYTCQNSKPAFPQAVPLQPAIQLTSQNAAVIGGSRPTELPLRSSLTKLHLVVTGKASEVHSTQESKLDPVETRYAGVAQQHLAFQDPSSTQNQSVGALLPLLPSRPATDLSSLFNHSFMSQQSFFPLEPHVDETTMTAPPFHHDLMAEHPYTDGQDYPCEKGSPPMLRSNSVNKHPVQKLDPRQTELQHYIQLLLDRSPGDPLNEKAKGLEGESQSISGANQQQPGPDAEVLSPLHVGEVSRLLGLYHPSSDKPTPTIEELFAYLRDVSLHRPTDWKGDGQLSSTKEEKAIYRNSEPNLGRAVVKEVVSSQTAGGVRRPSFSKPSSDKSQSAARTGRKSVNLSQQNCKTGRSGFWR